MDSLSFVTVDMSRPRSRMELLQCMQTAVDVVEGMFAGSERLEEMQVKRRFRTLFSDEHSFLMPFVYPNATSVERRSALWPRCIATSMIILTNPVHSMRALEAEAESLAAEPPPPRRASRAQVNAIPNAPFREYEEYQVGQRTGERLICPVCITKFRSNSRVKQLSCHHIFHAHCIDKALRQCSMHCPMCRREVHV